MGIWRYRTSSLVCYDKNWRRPGSQLQLFCAFRPGQPVYNHSDMSKALSKHPLLEILLSVPLRFKITIPYMFAATLLAGMTSYQVAHAYVSLLEDRFRGQLEDASFRVADEFFAVEKAHLAGIRTIDFTSGFPQAMAEQNSSEMERLAYPQVVNGGLYFVDLLDADGQLLASWHRQGETLEYRTGESTEYRNWGTVRAVLAGAVDEAGDKYAEIVDTPWGLALYTAAPVYFNGELAGVTLVGTPLRQVLPQVATRSLAHVTLYDSRGTPILSTLGDPSSLSPLPSAVLQNLLSDAGSTSPRKVQVGSRTYVEAMEILYLRQQPSGWFYGVALPAALVENAGASMLVPLLLIFILGLAVLFLLGVLVAQIIAIPVFRLLRASRAVGEGNFDAKVNVYAHDEIGQLTEGFNHMVDGLRQREFIREMFGRMVSRDVSEAILKGEVEIGGEERDVAVLFTDVRGFTSLAEKYAPEDVISLLNQFFGIIARATGRYHGVINHFGGDSVLAVFGAPIERPLTEALQQAISAALEIYRGVVEVNAERISKQQVPLGFGVGINSGTVIAGNIGTPDRFHYTVIGDVVNVAARLQGLSRQFPHTPLLIPENSITLPGIDAQFAFQRLGAFRLKGKERPVPTYAVLGIRTHYPADFTVFDEGPYPKMEAMMACYLFCKGYARPVIAEALQVDEVTVARWCKIAAEHAELVGQILVTHYHLPASCRYRLQDAMRLAVEA